MKRLLMLMNSLHDTIITLFTWIATVIFGTQCVVMLLQIFMRRVINRPFVWAEDLIVLLFVWLTYLGAAILYGKRKLITVDLFVMAMPKKFKRALSIFVDILIAVFSVYVLLQATKFFGNQVRLGHKLGGALGVPSWAMTAALIVSIASMVFSSVTIALTKLSGLASEK